MVIQNLGYLRNKGKNEILRIYPCYVYPVGFFHLRFHPKTPIDEYILDNVHFSVVDFFKNLTVFFFRRNIVKCITW